MRTPDTKPQTFNADLGKLPAALRPLTKLPRWVVWRWVKKKDKWTKPPFQVRDPQRNAKNNDPTTWGSYEEAVAQVEKGLADGIGFNLLGGDIGAVDLDDCRDPETGVIVKWAQAIIDRAPAGAYVEVTVSGTGLRIIGTTNHREDNFHRKFSVDGGGSYEVYGAVARYITISGLGAQR
jgi:primase-polymerase (primpol)-like protein